MFTDTGLAERSALFTTIAERAQDVDLDPAQTDAIATAVVG